MSVAVAHQHSPTGTIALREAAREAVLRQTELVVLNVVESLDLDAAAALEAGLTDEIQGRLSEAGFDSLAWRLVLGAEDEQVADEVVRLAVREQASLLVIGARKRSPLGKFLMGSATQSIILDAPMPVLVVKAP